jgi:CheY-like chemotaxis protein
MPDERSHRTTVRTSHVGGSSDASSHFPAKSVKPQLLATQRSLYSDYFFLTPNGTLSYPLPSSSCADGPRGVDAPKEHRPSLILMALELAGRGDGVDAAQQIHAGQNCPIILLTSNADLDARRRIFNQCDSKRSERVAPKHSGPKLAAHEGELGYWPDHDSDADPEPHVLQDNKRASAIDGSSSTITTRCLGSIFISRSSEPA